MSSRNSIFSVRAALRANNLARTPRKPNWSEIECEYLLQEIQKNLSMIRSRRPDCQGSRKSPKADMWNKMCMGLHVHRPTVMRSVREVKDKWKKLQFMAKQHIARIRFNSTAKRNPDGLIILPKLVYRVLEARGQDPKKLGFCSASYVYEITRSNTNSASTSEVNSSLAEQETLASQSTNINKEGETVKEEITDVDQLYQEPDFTLQIQSAVSLAPAYNQTEQGTRHQSVAASSTVPVSLEKAVSASQSDIRPTSFSISSRLLQNKTPRNSPASSRSYRQYQRAGRPAQRQPQCDQELRNSQLQFRQNVIGNPSPLNNGLDNSFIPCLDEQQNSMQLEDRDQLMLNNSLPGESHHDATYRDAIGEPSSLPPGPQPRRLCPGGFIGHVCDEQVVELQRDVLREERDKIRVEKELLEMQKEKLKLEMMVLRQKINGVC